MPWSNDSADLDAMSENLDEVDPATKQKGTDKQSRLISRVLAPAVRLWLKSQLDHVEDLHITIEASDRQLLSGAVSRVSASASKAIYQGLHLSQIQVVGEQIKTNLGQVVRGKPFRLLEPFPVVGDLVLSEADLNASLTSPLLAQAVTEFLMSLLQLDVNTHTATKDQAVSLQNGRVRLEDGVLTFTGTLKTPTLEQNVALRTGLTIKNGNILKLEGFQHQDSVEKLAPHGTTKANFTFPLGADVYLETLAVQQDQLLCSGKITVIPA